MRHARSGSKKAREARSSAVGVLRTQSFGSLSKADRDFLRSIGVSPENLGNGYLNPYQD
jgi:hypothetical protein